MKCFIYILSICAFNTSCVKESNYDVNNESEFNRQFNESKSIRKSKYFSAIDLHDYINSSVNLFTYHKKIERVNYFLKFKPLDFIISSELKGDLNNETYFNRYKEISDFDYFSLIISIDNFNQEPLRYELTQPDNYYKRLAYLMDEIGKDIKYFNGTDTVGCSISHFERTFNVSSYITINLAFEKSSGTGNRFFVFEDNLFNNGKIRIEMPKEIFLFQPKILMN